MVVRCLHQYGTALRPVSRLRRFLGRGKCFAEEYSSNMYLLIITQANCQLVVKGENYLPDYTPFTVDKQGKLIKSGVQIRVCGFTKQALGIHCKLKTEHCFADPADQNSQNWWSWTDIQESIHHVYDLVGICIITFSKYPSPGIALFVRLFVVTKLWLHARACVCVF